MSSLKILQQNDNFLIVDKPVGWSVHNQDQSPSLMDYFQQKEIKIYPVHRLDKETSGVQILALNESWARQLSEEFQSRNIEKIYLGIVCGAVKQDQGLWQNALSDKAEGRKNPAGLPQDQVNCQTEFKVLQRNKFFSLMQFNLLTGRQHQIRKHCVLNGHALLGDQRYGNENYNEKMFKIYKVSRMFLHCEKIQMKSLEGKAEKPLEFDQIISAN